MLYIPQLNPRNINWQVIDTGYSSALKNMEVDSQLLQSLNPEGPPILHLYDWEGDSATYGHFINPYELLNENEVKKNNLQLAKRPTGGGIIFHICDFAFSVLIPSSHPEFSINSLDNYSFINKKVIQVLQQLTSQSHFTLLPHEPTALDPHSKYFCMAKPTKYDVIMEGKKIGGAAQRRTKNGFLHQSSINVALLSQDYLSSILIPNSKVLESMNLHSASLLGTHWTQSQLKEMRQTLKEHIYEIFIK